MARKYIPLFLSCRTEKNGHWDHSRINWIFSESDGWRKILTFLPIRSLEKSIDFVFANQISPKKKKPKSLMKKKEFRLETLFPM